MYNCKTFNALKGNTMTLLDEKLAEKAAYDFETQFGMCFQPFVENLYKAEDFIRNLVRTTRSHDRQVMEKEILEIKSRCLYAKRSVPNKYEEYVDNIIDYVDALQSKLGGEKEGV